MLPAIPDLPLAWQFASPGPILVQIGPFILRWYGLLIASAVLIGVTLSQYLAKRRHVNPDIIGDLAIWLVVGAIPAARLYYVLFEWSNYANNPGKIFAIWEGGIAIHGAILGGIVAALIFCRIRKISFWQVLKPLAVRQIYPGNSISLPVTVRLDTGILSTSIRRFFMNRCGI